MSVTIHVDIHIVIIMRKADKDRFIPSS